MNVLPFHRACHFLCRKLRICKPKGPFSPKLAPNRRSRGLSFLGGEARAKKRQIFVINTALRAAHA